MIEMSKTQRWEDAFRRIATEPVSVHHSTGNISLSPSEFIDVTCPGLERESLPCGQPVCVEIGPVPLCFSCAAKVIGKLADLLADLLAESIA